MILGIEKDLLSQMGLIERCVAVFSLSFLMCREPNAEEVIAVALLDPDLTEFVMTGQSLTELPDDIRQMGGRLKVLELGALNRLFFVLSFRLQYARELACTAQFVSQSIAVVSHC